MTHQLGKPFIHGNELDRHDERIGHAAFTFAVFLAAPRIAVEPRYLVTRLQSRVQVGPGHVYVKLLRQSDEGGCQYTSDAYQQTLRTLGIDCSMSRTGCCYDNAVAERFFWSLKHEWTKHLQLIDLEHARLSVFKYIETFYNPVRIHQTLDYLSPNQYEAVHAPAPAA